MRKRLKNKKRACALCKPHKRKWENRWSVKDRRSLLEYERVKKEVQDGKQTS